MTDPVDDQGLRALTEESADLHADVMHATRSSMEDLAEATIEEKRSHGLRSAGLVAAAAGGLALAAAAPALAATSDTDTMALQTAASIENLAVAVYSKALTLSFISGNATVKAFAQMTMAQHQQHAQAFNAAVTTLGGAAQHNPDPKYLKAVQSALPSLTGAAAVVKLAIALEDVAAQTYTKNVSQVSTAHLRSLFGSIAPIEAQHKAVLLAVQALLAAGKPQLIEISPTVVTQLPAAAGSVGFPNAFYPTSSASPVTEGAIK